MRTATSMLTWIWWKHPILLSIALVSVLASQFYYWSGLGLEGDSISVAQGYLLTISIFVTTIAAFVVFTFGNELDLTSGKPAFPRWFYCLPANPARLAIVPVVAMVAGLALAWLPFAVIVMREEQLTDMDNPIWSFGMLPWLGMCAIGTWIQSIAWWPFRSAVRRMTSIAFLTVATSVLLSYGYAYPILYNVGIPLAAALGCFAAIASASIARHRGWFSDSTTADNWLSRVLSVFRTGDKSNVDAEGIPQTRLADYRSLNFESKQDGLLWRDWKQLVRIPVILMLIMAIPTLILALTLESSPNGIAILLAPFMICLFASPTLGKNRYWKGAAPISPFLATLPISDHRLLKSRILSVLRTSLVTWAIAAIVFIAWFYNAGNREVLGEVIAGFASSSGAEKGLPVFLAFSLTLLIVTVVAPFPGFAIGLCGRKKIDLAFFISIASFGFIGFMVASIKMYQINSILNSAPYKDDKELTAQYLSELYGQTPTVLAWILLAKLALCIVPIALLVRRKISDWKSIGLVAMGITMATGLVLSVYWLLLQEADENFRATWVLVMALFMPCSSLFFLRFALDWNRHR